MCALFVQWNRGNLPKRTNNLLSMNHSTTERLYHVAVQILGHTTFPVFGAKTGETLVYKLNINGVSHAPRWCTLARNSELPFWTSPTRVCDDHRIHKQLKGAACHNIT